MKLPNNQVNPETANIHVTVIDSNETAIYGATVTIDEITGTTINGGCNLENVPVSIQTITVTKEGYEEYSDSITIVSEGDNEFTIILTEE